MGHQNLIFLGDAGMRGISMKVPTRESVSVVVCGPSKLSAAPEERGGGAHCNHTCALLSFLRVQNILLPKAGGKQPGDAGPGGPIRSLAAKSCCSPATFGCARAQPARTGNGGRRSLGFKGPSKRRALSCGKNATRMRRLPVLLPSLHIVGPRPTQVAALIQGPKTS